jgi:hypothetical protein
MRIYIIANDGITLCPEMPAAMTEGEIAVASKEDLHAAPLSGKRLLALWNGLPRVEKRRKVGDRAALIDQLWTAIEALPEPEPQSDAKRPSKQGEVIAMLRRPEGATVDEAASAMGWQRPTVRGLLSGTLKKKLGLTLASAQEERGRVYRIAAPERADELAPARFYPNRQRFAWVVPSTGQKQWSAFGASWLFAAIVAGMRAEDAHFCAAHEPARIVSRPGRERDLKHPGGAAFGSAGNWAGSPPDRPRDPPLKPLMSNLFRGWWSSGFFL